MRRNVNFGNLSLTDKFKGISNVNIFFQKIKERKQKQ